MKTHARLFRKFEEERRREREAPRRFVQAILAGDIARLCASIEELDEYVVYGWKRAFRLCARLSSVPDETRSAFLTL